MVDVCFHLLTTRSMELRIGVQNEIHYLTLGSGSEIKIRVGIDSINTLVESNIINLFN